jgi:hypothetical protein
VLRLQKKLLQDRDEQEVRQMVTLKAVCFIQAVLLKNLKKLKSYKYNYKSEKSERTLKKSMFRIAFNSFSNKVRK